MLRIEKVQEKDRGFFGISINNIYEITNFYDDPMDEDGNHHYGYFDEYFSDSKRVAYFIHNDGTLARIAMFCPYSAIEQNPDHTMDEFTIFPTF